METYKLNIVLEDEKEILTERRKKLFGDESASDFEKNKFGIALSGGGIRSATINLGFLKTLNLFKILEKADYISTVSGGGYTGAYLQATIKQEDGYDELFEEKKISRLKKYGDYWIPGQDKLTKFWNTLLLTFGYLASWAMSLFSPATVVIMGYLLFKSIASLQLFQVGDVLLDWNYPDNDVLTYLVPALWVLGGLLFLHFLSNIVFNFNLDISKFFSHVETMVAIVILIYLGIVAVLTLDTSSEWSNQEILYALIGFLAIYFIGYILNPNSLSFHRYYRKQLADAFLQHSEDFKNMHLKDVFKIDGKRREYLAPYPLINTCLNLQNPGGEDKFKGAKASDYFLLSPRWSGSKLSNYVSTEKFPGFKHMTLPAALTISAAAVNPGMGIYSNKMLSVLMTLFNARLGFWVNNPSAKPRKIFPKLTNFAVWWPSYFFKELLSKIGTKNRKLNVSDGGHIENLAVYELLRRECRLILAVDAGADPQSNFSDLENLAIRARNELGIDICFREGQDPVDIIKPKASTGYASKRFAVADLMRVWEEFPIEDMNGDPVKFTRRVLEDGKIEEKEEQLEALVNYFYSKTDSKVLKFKVDLKATEGVDLSKGVYNFHLERAIKKVEDKLAHMHSLDGSEKIKIGTLVYIKSSVTSPRKLYVPEYMASGEKNPNFDSFKYKIYHPDFPHESTADQFFDPVQWSSYFQLGQFIATDVLGAPRQPDDYQRGAHEFEINDLIAHFDGGQPLFSTENMASDLIDASAKKEEERPEKTEASIKVPQVPATEERTIEEDESVQSETYIQKKATKEIEDMAEQLKYKI